MNHTLSWTIGPANTAFTSYTERVPLLVIAPAALSASLMLSACRLWLVPLANSVPLKRLPPSRGITLSTTPLLVYSADRAAGRCVDDDLLRCQRVDEERAAAALAFEPVERHAVEQHLGVALLRSVQRRARAGFALAAADILRVGRRLQPRRERVVTEQRLRARHRGRAALSAAPSGASPSACRRVATRPDTVTVSSIAPMRS